MTIDRLQERKINILFGVVSIIAAGATIWWIIDQKKHSKMEEEIFALDKEIKEHQLKKIKDSL